MDIIYIVIDEDRHTDVDVYPFSTEEAAVVFANRVAEMRCRRGEKSQEVRLTDIERKQGWVYLVKYGTEGDCLTVVKKEIDNPPL